MEMERTGVHLTQAQQRALNHVENLSSGWEIDRSLRITMNFHPDRVQGSMHILDSLVRTGVYMSQFETKTSNGGLSAHPGGDRWNWESRIFGAEYDAVQPSERPKYGGLNYKRSQYGASPRFGSAHLRLRENVLDRATFCYPDSVFQPDAFGTAKHMSLVELAAADKERDLLDDYIEAQIHGEINIARDVEAIVLDPCYRGTEVEQLSLKLGCPLEFHDGFELTVQEMEKYPSYRGIEVIEVGRDIAENGILTPAVIGNALVTGRYDLPILKKVWHYVARYGQK